MLTFLRQIRKSLIESGSTRRYLLYSLGEIALVVIGILIALQINNWNESRKDRKAESVILHNLLSDMKQNHRQIGRKISGSNRSQHIMTEKRGLFVVPAETIAQTELDTLIKAMNDIASFDPIVGTINEMMNSGSIEVIKNEKLRRLISSWSSYLDEVREEENLSRIAQNEYVIPYLMEHAAMADWMSIGTYGGVVNFKNHQEADITFILTDRRFENLINYSISRREWTVLRYTAMQGYLQEMIDLVQFELNISSSPLN